MSNRSIIIVAVIVIIGTACYFCSDALWEAMVAMHHRG
jgi:hypothetical protein